MRSLGEMDRRTKLVAGVGLALIAFLLLYFLLLSGREPEVPPPSQPSQGFRVMRKEMLKPLPFQVEESPAVREKRFRGRDPFRPPILTSGERRILEEKRIKETEERRRAQEERERKKELVKEELDSMNLSGIIWDPEGSLALINGKEVKVGDMVGSFKVKRIEKDRVILSFEGKDFLLILKED